MVTITKATVEDLDILKDVAITSFLQSHGHSASAADIDSYVSQAFSSETISKELSDLKNIFRLIYYNDVPAGYSKIVLNAPIPAVNDKQVTKLERLYLLEAFYELKLGKELLDHNIAISKNANQTGMWLHTWVENDRAIAFYKKAGFRVIGKADFKISATHSNPNHLMYMEY
jgi:ribosomal protein S18 acetylase RimI-like enzyme